MLTRAPHSTRRNVLLGITALVVAYVRSYLQYHQYSWQSIEQFVISWLIHYLAILGLVAISYAFINTKADFFLGNKTERDRKTKEEATVYVSIVLLVAAVLIFFVAHWPQSDIYE
jgi:formate hydrogenlyase subunit 3/multisubunit Na+/H+ antiporter MnhD subunit